MSKSQLVLATVVVMSGCTGPAGPSGPMGTTGAMGTPGPMGNPGTGVAGVDGMNGQSVTVVPLDAGNTICPAGGAQLVAGDGGTVVVCNGTGTSGNSSVYGSGGGGALNITTNTDWTAMPPPTFEFTDITIAPGATLTLPSGITLLATGAFTNLGTIEVQAWGGSGVVEYAEEPLPDGGPGPLTRVSGTEPGRGASARGAKNGVVTRRRENSPSAGGQPMSMLSAMKLIRITGEGGGAGGSSCIDGQCFGGNGGGSFSLRARGVVQAGAIHANGTVGWNECSGGGAGGVVVIASGASISVGVITARGAGGTSNGLGAPCTAGGTGGGGLVRLIAPQIGQTTTVDVASPFGFGSLYGTALGPVNATSGGGGACAGHGGAGGGLRNNALDTGGAGGDGLVLTTQIDPELLF